MLGRTLLPLMVEEVVEEVPTSFLIVRLPVILQMAIIKLPGRQLYVVAADMEVEARCRMGDLKIQLNMAAMVGMEPLLFGALKIKTTTFH